MSGRWPPKIGSLMMLARRQEPDGARKPDETAVVPSRRRRGLRRVWPSDREGAGIGTGERARRRRCGWCSPGLQPAGGTRRRDLAADHQAGEVGEVVLARRRRRGAGATRTEKIAARKGRPSSAVRRTASAKSGTAAEVAAVVGDGVAEEGDARESRSKISPVRKVWKSGDRAAGDRHPFRMGAGMDRDAGESRLALDRVRRSAFPRRGSRRRRGADRAASGRERWRSARPRCVSKRSTLPASADRRRPGRGR